MPCAKSCELCNAAKLGSLSFICIDMCTNLQNLPRMKATSPSNESKSTIQTSMSRAEQHLFCNMQALRMQRLAEPCICICIWLERIACCQRRSEALDVALALSTWSRELVAPTSPWGSLFTIGNVGSAWRLSSWMAENSPSSPVSCASTVSICMVEPTPSASAVQLPQCLPCCRPSPVPYSTGNTSQDVPLQSSTAQQSPEQLPTGTQLQPSDAPLAPVIPEILSPRLSIPSPSGTAAMCVLPNTYGYFEVVHVGCDNSIDTD